MAAPSIYCGGVAIFYCEAEHFPIENLRLHGSNIISFQMVTGDRNWFVVG